MIVGLLGIGLLFNPATFDWHDRNAVIGNGLLLLSALCWSVSILYTRAHKWVSQPLQLVPWQALISAAVLTVIAAFLEGTPSVTPSTKLIAAFAYCSVIGGVVAYWAMTIVNSSLPATTTSLGVLATPIVGIVVSAIALGEQIEPVVVAAAVLVIAGIAVGTTADKAKAAKANRPAKGASRNQPDALPQRPA